MSQRRGWLLAALAAPVIHLSAGLGWWTAAVVAAAGAALQLLPSWKKREETKQKRESLARWGISILAAGEVMEIMADCWPGQNGIRWVMGILLLLSGYLASKGREQTMEASVLLWWLIGFLFGSVLLSAVPEIKLGHLKAEYTIRQWRQALRLLAVLLIPGLMPEKRSKEETWQLGLAVGTLAVAAALCTQGVRSFRSAAQDEAPFYELSRSIRLYGTLDRMEGLAWLGLMLGSFLCLSYLMTAAAENGERAGRTARSVWLAAAVILAGVIEAIKIPVSILVLVVLLILYGNRRELKTGRKPE